MLLFLLSLLTYKYLSLRSESFHLILDLNECMDYQLYTTKYYVYTLFIQKWKIFTSLTEKCQIFQKLILLEDPVFDLTLVIRLKLTSKSQTSNPPTIS